MSTAAMNNSRSSKSDALDESMNASVTSTTSTASQNRLITEPILYKTKMCRNFMRDGYCVYETKCMFAHGSFDVRIVEQNVKEGLTSEDRVKRFQTKSIIMLKQKTRKEQPPSFQEALVQVAENEKPRFANSSVTSPTEESATTTPATSITAEPNVKVRKGTPPPKGSSKGSRAPREQQQQRAREVVEEPEAQSDAIIDIILPDEAEQQTPEKSQQKSAEEHSNSTDYYAGHYHQGHYYQGDHHHHHHAPPAPNNHVRQHQPYSAQPSYDGYYAGSYGYGSPYGAYNPNGSYGSSPYAYCDCPTCNAQRASTPAACSCVECMSPSASMTSYSAVTSPSASMSAYPGTMGV